MSSLTVLGILLALMSFGNTAFAQLRITGQASSAYIKSNDGYSQYAINHGRQTFAWRLDLFGDATISDNIFFLSNIRLQQDQILRLDLLEIKVTDLASTGLNIELGEIELPFGNLGERRFPKSNPFYSLPLMNEHLTTLRSSDYELWFADSRYTINGNGVHVLDQGLYDLGVKLSGGIGIFDYWIAVVNGMVSATSTYSSNYASSGLNPKSGMGTVIRLAATPITGLTIGSAFAHGPFLKEDIYYPWLSEYDPSDIPQNAYEGDIDFSFEHVVLSGQVVYSEWKFNSVLGSDLKAFGYTFEGRYTPAPRLTLAARAGGLWFNTVTINIYSSNYGVQQYYGKWDHDVFRLEGSVGYRLDRSALLKLVYQWNKILNVINEPVDNVLVIQTVVNF